MYPFVRLLTSSLKSVMSEKIDILDLCETQFYSRPWDLDLFMEVNNGRVLTLYDLGRFDLANRSGLSKVLLKNRWGLVVAGSTIMYRKRVKIFDKVTIKTKVVGLDEKWIYITQSMWVKDKATSSVLLRTGVTMGGKVIETQRVAAAMGLAELALEEMPDWINAWIMADAQRNWPPGP